MAVGGLWCETHRGQVFMVFVIVQYMGGDCAHTVKIERIKLRFGML